MFDIHADVADSRLTPAIGAASRRLRSMVGDTAYADTADADRLADLKYAEGLLAMHFAMTGLNTQIRPAGLVKTEKIEGETVVQYLTPKEVSEMALAYLEQAEEVVRPYKTDELPATAELVDTDG